MGVLYVIGSIALAGLALDIFTNIIGEGKAEKYDYHFAPGVGAVFGATK